MLFNTTRKTSAWLEDAPKHGRAYLRAVAAGAHLSPAPLSPDSAASRKDGHEHDGVLAFPHEVCNIPKDDPDTRQALDTTLGTQVGPLARAQGPH